MLAHWVADKNRGTVAYILNQKIYILRNTANVVKKTLKYATYSNFPFLAL